MEIFDQVRADERAMMALRELYTSFGYQRFRMGRFEEYDLYVRNKDFLVSDEIITFTDRSGRLLALKPDVTLSIIKNAKDAPGVVQKVYYNENVYRVAGGSNGFREIMQAGLECVGDLGEYEIAEVVLLAANSLAAISEDFMLDISHMGVISAVLEESGLSDEQSQQALSCLRQKNCHELKKLCDGWSVPAAAKQKLLALAGEIPGPGLEALLTGQREQAAFAQLKKLWKILEDNGFAGRVQMDFSVGNDLKYYSGVVFKGYIPGIPVGILSGGQYDKLLRKMGRGGSAIGFALYLDLLERLETGKPEYDADILLDAAGADAGRVIAVAQALRRQGSVLVTTGDVSQFRCRKCYRMKDGEAILLENNG